MSLKVKLITVIFAMILAVVCILSVISVRSIQTSSFETAMLMGRNKLSGDIASLEDKFVHEYGQISLKNGDLVDAQGNSIKNDYRVVDQISRRLGVHATIFMREGEDYRRISTSIMDNSGKRAVDTFLGSASAAYSSIKAGNDYFGNAVIQGEDYITAYRSLHSADSSEVIGVLFIGIKISLIEKYIINARNSKIIQQVIAAAIILMAASVITLFFAKGIVKPIIGVTQTLKDISEGEGDLTRRIIYSSRDEVGDLSRYFNLTLEKIKNLVITIKNETETLSGAGTDLARDMNETAAAMNEITATIQSIKGRVINQSASVSQTHATMEILTGNINDLDEHIESQTANVTQASAAIEEMIANIQSVTSTLVNNTVNVHTLIDSSGVGRTGLNEVAADIQEIAHESKSLLEINSVMANIASQTNLLSMNAAIEAAHAGESGKGFAVVANEIRKLAESSSQQSKTIGAALKKIKGSIDKITVSTENVLHKFEAIDSSVRVVAEQEESVRAAMEEQGTGSKQVLDGIGEVTEITRKVKNSSNEMLDEAKEVITESTNLERVTQEITSGMNEMASGVEQINLAVNHINELSGKTREGIDTLMKEVSRFKVA